MKYLSLMLCCLCAFRCFADVAVVVHPSNNVDLNKSEISRLFLGKSNTFPSGNKAVPLANKEGGAVDLEFNEKVLGRSLSQLKAHWAKLLFTGKGTPPKAMDSDADVIASILSQPAAIGYVSIDSVTSDVRVVATY